MREIEFTPDERHIIRYYESTPGFNWVVWMIHVFLTALFAYGLYRSDNALLFAAFGGMICWRIYESTYQPRFFRATRSVLQKYADQADKTVPNSGEHP